MCSTHQNTCNGNYSFNNLPLQSYNIYVDIPNYGMDSVLTITLASGSANSSNNNYYVDSIKVHVDTAQYSSGIKHFAGNDNQISIYPNPNNGNFTIESNNNAKQTMQLYDVNGKLVLSQTINGKTMIDADILNEGVYNISIINDQGVVNKRLVIVK